MNNKLLILLIITSMNLLYAKHAYAAENQNYLTGTAGVFAEIGQLGNSGMDLKNRTMTSLSFDGLVGSDYFDRWILGLDFNYRLQQQQTKLSETGNTNLAGKSWALGLGALYRWNTDWAFQAGLDFLGRYTFDKQTSGGQDDHLESPIFLRFKAEYFLRSNLTLDFGAGCYRWSTFHIGTSNRSETSQQWTLGTGLTYHFSKNTKLIPTAPTQASLSVEVPSKSEPQTPSVPELKTSGIQFEANSIELSEDLINQIKDIANYLNSHPETSVVINGYTDSSGRFLKNKKLSMRRANAVKKVLIENDVDAKRITTVGFGEKNPIADNSTIEGRIINRRVEINLGK